MGRKTKPTELKRRAGLEQTAFSKMSASGMETRKPRASDAIQKVHCNSCRRVTLHRLLKTAIEEGSEHSGVEGYEDWEVSWETKSQMLECCGCKNVVLRKIYWFSEDGGPPDVTYYPPPISRHPPQWKYKLPLNLRNMLEEVYRALDANCSAVSMMGARTLLDMLMSESVGDAGGFSQKLDALENKGVISSQNKKVLDSALEACNAAAHRGFRPNTDDVHAVMDIVENLLQSVYVFDEVEKNLRKITPPRPPKKPKSKTKP